MMGRSLAISYSRGHSSPWRDRNPITDDPDVHPSTATHHPGGIATAPPAPRSRCPRATHHPGGIATIRRRHPLGQPLLLPLITLEGSQHLLGRDEHARHHGHSSPWRDRNVTCQRTHGSRACHSSPWRDRNLFRLTSSSSSSCGHSSPWRDRNPGSWYGCRGSTAATTPLITLEGSQHQPSASTSATVSGHSSPWRDRNTERAPGVTSGSPPLITLEGSQQLGQSAIRQTLQPLITLEGSQRVPPAHPAHVRRATHHPGGIAIGCRPGRGPGRRGHSSSWRDRNAGRPCCGSGISSRPLITLEGSQRPHVRLSAARRRGTHHPRGIATRRGQAWRE